MQTVVLRIVQWVKMQMLIRTNPNNNPDPKLGNSAEKLRHPRSAAYTAELVLLNKHPFSGCGACLHYYPKLNSNLTPNNLDLQIINTVLKFADDTKVFRTVIDEEDNKAVLPEDLQKLSE